MPAAKKEKEKPMVIETMGEYLKRNGGSRPSAAPERAYRVTTVGEAAKAAKPSKAKAEPVESSND